MRAMLMRTSRALVCGMRRLTANYDEALLMLHPNLKLRTAVSVKGLTSISSMAMTSLFTRKTTSPQAKSSDTNTASSCDRSIFRKVVLCPQLRDVWKYVPQNSVQLPQFIMDCKCEIENRMWRGTKEEK